MDEIKHREQVDLIREVFYYQNRFDGKTIVLKIDYPILNASHFPQLLKDMAMLSATGIEIILIPGAREWIDAVLKEYDIESEYVDGVRIATQDSIPFIRMAAFDVANRLMTLLTAFQANAVIGNFVRARGIGVVDGVDFQNSGRVEKILKEPLQQILDQGMIPIFPCIGWNAAGKPYNLSSDDIAVGGRRGPAGREAVLRHRQRRVHGDSIQASRQGWSRTAMAASHGSASKRPRRS